jgi:hypothetical protein
VKRCVEGDLRRRKKLKPGTYCQCRETAVGGVAIGNGRQVEAVGILFSIAF